MLLDDLAKDSVIKNPLINNLYPKIETNVNFICQYTEGLVNFLIENKHNQIT